jgi:hypothetical protein
MNEKKVEPGAITAEELMGELEADADFVHRREEREAELQRKAADWRQAEAPLIEELRSAGFTADSAWDLVNTATPYPAALPILLDHLQRPYPDRVREGIARALAVPDAKFGWDVLTRLYRQEPKGTDAKDGLAVALAATADDEVVDDLMLLADDTRHGKSRVLLLSALARSDDERARAALGELQADPELAAEAQRLLKQSG